MKDLGTFNGTDSEALDVNSSGQIVGTFKQNGPRHGFKLTGSGFADLFTTAGMEEAVGINDSGVILGSVATGPDSNLEHQSRLVATDHVAGVRLCHKGRNLRC